MKYERPCGARRECRRQALRKPRGTTANRAARRERESPIGPPYGAHREQQRQALRNPSRHNRNPRGTAGARKSDRPTLRRTSGTAKASPPQPLATQPQTARHGGSAKALSALPAAPVGNCKGIPPPKPRRTTAKRAARRERGRKPRGTRRRRDEAWCVVPPLASDYLPLARCRLTRRNSRLAVCALRFARAA